MNRVSCIGSYHASRITHHALRNERGIALVMVLILSALALAIMAGLIYMLTSGTQVSGIQKRYKTALEAGMGGRDVTYQVIGLKSDSSNISSFIDLLPNKAVTTPDTCVVANTSTTLLDGTTCGSHVNDCASWPVGYRGLCVKLNIPTICWSGCDSSLTINPPSSGDNTTYDMRFDLGNYRAYEKIVGTIEGNSGADLGLTKSGVVNSNTGEVTVVSIPYLYTIEVDAENPYNPAERAKLSVLYQY